MLHVITCWRTDGDAANDFEEIDLEQFEVPNGVELLLKQLEIFLDYSLTCCLLLCSLEMGSSSRLLS